MGSQLHWYIALPGNDQTGIMVTDRRATEIKCPFHHIVSRAHTINKTYLRLRMLPWVTWLRLHTALFGRKSLSAPPVKKWKVKFLSLRIQLLKLFGIMQQTWFVSLLTLLIYLICMASWIFILHFGLESSAALLFSFQIVPVLITGSSFSWLLCHFEKLPSLYACVSVVFKNMFILHIPNF